MRTGLALVLAFWACAGAALGDALPDDPALSKPITLDVKGEALTDIMDVIEKQADVSLRASRSVADWKATIFVDEKPLREVMDGLATLFKLRWRVTKSDGRQTYELFQDERSRREPGEQWQKAFKQAMEEMDAKLKEKARITVEDDAKIRAVRAAYRKALRLVESTEDDPREPFYRLYNSLNDAERETVEGRVALARLYCSMSRQAREALQSGTMTVCYDSQSPEPEWRLPQDITGELLGITGWDPPGWSGEPLGVNVQMYVSVSAYHVTLSSRVQARFAAGTKCSTQEMLFSKNVEEMVPGPAALLPRDPDDKALDKKVSLSAKELVDEADIPGLTVSSPRIFVNRSDVLALLHRKLGLQVISDHYSHWQRWSPEKDRAARQILDAFKDGMNESGHSLWGLSHEMAGYGGIRRCGALWGWDGKFLYMRIRDVPQSDDAEIPNSLIRRWRAAYAARGAFGLDDLAQMAVLGEGQTKSLYRNWRFFRLGEDDHSTLVDRRLVPVLRLYGLLETRQRKTAFAGGTDVSSFTSEQMAALWEICGVDLMDYTGPAGFQKRHIPAHDRIIVGIYQAGARVDKPVPPVGPGPPQPVSVAMRQDGTEDRFYHEELLGAFLPLRTPLPGARTEQEALTMARVQHPKATLADIVRQHATKYTVTIALSDRTVQEIPMSISTFIRHPRAEVSPERDEKGG